MNKQRRKEIQETRKELQKINDKFQLLLNAEEESLSNLPESLQSSSMAMDMDDYINILSISIDTINDAIGYLEEI